MATLAPPTDPSRPTELHAALGTVAAVTLAYAWIARDSLPAASGVFGHGIGVVGFLLMLVAETDHTEHRGALASLTRMEGGDFPHERFGFSLATHVEQWGRACPECHEHTPARIRAEHLEEGIPDFRDCVSCHPKGREEEGERRRRD